MIGRVLGLRSQTERSTQRARAMAVADLRRSEALATLGEVVLGLRVGELASILQLLGVTVLALVANIILRGGDATIPALLVAGSAMVYTHGVGALQALEARAIEIRSGLEDLALEVDALERSITIEDLAHHQRRAEVILANRLRRAVGEGEHYRAHGSLIRRVGVVALAVAVAAVGLAMLTVVALLLWSSGLPADQNERGTLAALAVDGGLSVLWARAIWPARRLEAHASKA